MVPLDQTLVASIGVHAAFNITQSVIPTQAGIIQLVFVAPGLRLVVGAGPRVFQSTRRLQYKDPKQKRFKTRSGRPDCAL
jgi:hypothetical protein